MPQPPRKSKIARPNDPEFQSQVRALLQQGMTRRAMAAQLGSSHDTINRTVWAITANGHPSDPLTSLHRVELEGEPVSAVSVQNSAVQNSAVLPSIPETIPATVQMAALDSAEALADHETRLQVLESFVATLQAHVLQPPVPHITVQSSADSAYALPSAETVQTWDDPDDAKPERWNLWLPRGLKRRIEVHAKSAGIAPSQLVQRLLMAALPRPEGER